MAHLCLAAAMSAEDTARRTLNRPACEAFESVPKPSVVERETLSASGALEGTDP